MGFCVVLGVVQSIRIGVFWTVSLILSCFSFKCFVSYQRKHFKYKRLSSTNSQRILLIFLRFVSKQTRHIDRLTEIHYTLSLSLLLLPLLVWFVWFMALPILFFGSSSIWYRTSSYRKFISCSSANRWAKVLRIEGQYFKLFCFLEPSTSKTTHQLIQLPRSGG